MGRDSWRSRLKRDFWRRDSDKVWARKEVGWGWTINLAALRRKLRRS